MGVLLTHIYVGLHVTDPILNILGDRKYFLSYKKINVATKFQFFDEHV